MNSLLMKYKDKIYPQYLCSGEAAKYIIPFAQEFCKGDGLDIGGLLDCHFPGARIINIAINDKFDAYELPFLKGGYDYIFSSHTLEHLIDYVKALKYWISHLKDTGVLFLYLPHPNMEYWLPQNDKKHLHIFYPEMVKKLLQDLGFVDVIISERDLYWSFSAVGLGLKQYNGQKIKSNLLL